MYGLLPLTGVLRYKVKSIHSNQLLPVVHTMTQCSVIAIDLAKDIFQVCIMTPNGKITFNKPMSRAKLKEWLVKQKLSLVAMESFGGAHELTGINWGQGQLKLISWALLQFRQFTWM
jgi:hypothetical protein